MPGQAEADQFLDGMVDDLFEDGISDLERRRMLEQSVALGRDIDRDLAGDGPLMLYLKERRVTAKAALEALVTINPKDAPGIARLQSLVNEYITPCHWIAAKREEGRQDAQTIKEEFPADGDEPERYED